MVKKARIAVFVSGGGTNLQALIDAQGSVLTSGKITLVVSNNRDAYALERAKNAGIEDLTSEIFKENYTSGQVHITSSGLSAKPQQEPTRIDEINKSFNGMGQSKPAASQETSSTSNLPEWLRKKYKK